MTFTLWLTGLSGSGKSAVAKALLPLLHARGVALSVLESDVLRTQLTPYARYDEAERDFFYGALADCAVHLAGRGRAVIVDATANRRAYRDRARAASARFAEVYVATPLEVCAARDTKGLYGSSQVHALPGVGAPYEPPLAPEVVVHGDRGTPEEGAQSILAFLQQRGWIRP